MLLKRAEIIAGLQTDILRLQGFKGFKSDEMDVGLGPIKHAFPNSTFPIGAVHEFLTSRMEDAASTCGFISGLLSTLMGQNGAMLWISSSRTVFPPALKSFGIQPDRCIFIDVHNEKDVLWVMNEALKCCALNAVVGEIGELSFTESRRLQLSVEESQVTGFVFRRSTRKVTPTAFVSRWRISSLASDSIDDLPGLGFPSWRVDLLRIRNGKPGSWNLHWHNGKFISSDSDIHSAGSLTLSGSKRLRPELDDTILHQKQAG